MNKKLPPIAKISRPRSQDVFLRKTLFSLLDFRRKQPVVWVCGPAGSGKTTLVNSYIEAQNLQRLWYQLDSGDGDPATLFHYLGLAARKASPRKRHPLPHLTPEYLMGIQTFTRRFFENLYSRLGIPSTIVFDDYHEVQGDSQFHEVLRVGLSEVPEGINVIIISRGEPPQVFERMRTNRLMSVISWDDLRLSYDELKGIVLRKGLKNISNDEVQWLHARTEGWLAGLLLLMEKPDTERVPIHFLENHSHEAVFNYFAGEMFAGIDAETQGLLAKSALLPSMTSSMVDRLTGMNNSDSTLFELHKRNFFVELRKSNRQTVYRYHAMFREFLLFRAEKLFTPQQLLELKQKAVMILEESDNFEEAAGLCIDLGDWDRLARLINVNAEQYSVNGRTQILLAMLKAFPQEVMDDNPWLSYWRGMCELFYRPGDSIRYYEKAFDSFKAKSDLKGMVLTICSIIRAVTIKFENFKEIDCWVVLLDELMHKPEFAKERAIMDYMTSCLFLPLSLRHPDHPDFPVWRERAHKILENNVDINLRADLYNSLAIHYIMIGDFTNARVIINLYRKLSKSQHITPPVIIMGLVVDVHYHFVCALDENCIAAVKKGLQVGEYNGIYPWKCNLLGMGAASFISVENLVEAENYLDQMARTMNPSNNFDGGFYNLLMGWYFLQKNDLSIAAKYMEKSYQQGIELGLFFMEAISSLGLAQVFYENGDLQNAYVFLENARRIAERVKDKCMLFQYFLFKAQFSPDKHDDNEGIADLRTALAKGRENGYVNFLLWRSEVMAKLCIKALTAGIEVDYVRELIRKRNLVPETPPLDVENWPWPLKIYTLGRFEIMKDQKHIRFSRKAPQKPLTMLKVLIAFGGDNISEARMSDALWPDADGDAAHHVFTTTLSRLRKLIGVEEALTLHEGRLSLNPRYCRVDSQAFERVLEEAEVLSGNGNEDACISMMEKAIGMYHGNFLAGDIGEPWAISTRERLRSKFTKCLSKLGSHWEEAGQFEKAIECYLKGLEVYDLAEEFYQKLMICYHQMGRNAEAFGVYKRLKKVLSSTSGLNPSIKTEHILKSLTSE